MISDSNPHADQSAQKNENLVFSMVGQLFLGEKRITTYTRAFKMESTNVNIFCMVNESFEKK